jgi:hypothetical protein
MREGKAYRGFQKGHGVAHGNFRDGLMSWWDLIQRVSNACSSRSSEPISPLLRSCGSLGAGVHAFSPPVGPYRRSFDIASRLRGRLSAPGPSPRAHSTPLLRRVSCSSTFPRWSSAKSMSPSPRHSAGLLLHNAPPTHRMTSRPRKLHMKPRRRLWDRSSARSRSSSIAAR